MSTAGRLPRSRARLRILVLLLALLVPGAHARAPAVPMVAGAPGEAAEHDVLDTVLRPPARAERRSTAGLRPAPPSGAAPGVPVPLALPAPPRPPRLPPLLRTVVLRC